MINFNLTLKRTRNAFYNFVVLLPIYYGKLMLQVVIASMRQLVRLQEGKTAKIKDIPGFLTQCISSKVNRFTSALPDLQSDIVMLQVRQSKDTLIHVFIDEIPFSAFLNDDNKKY